MTKVLNRLRRNLFLCQALRPDSCPPEADWIAAPMTIKLTQDELIWTPNIQHSISNRGRTEINLDIGYSLFDIGYSVQKSLDFLLSRRDNTFIAKSIKIYLRPCQGRTIRGLLCYKRSMPSASSKLIITAAPLHKNPVYPVYLSWGGLKRATQGRVRLGHFISWNVILLLFKTTYHPNIYVGCFEKQ